MDLSLVLIGFGIVTIVVVVAIYLAGILKDRRDARLRERETRRVVAPREVITTGAGVRPAQESWGEPPTFRVVALGLEGSGKTVLLASQFHMLNRPIGDCRFFLDGDLRQDKLLFGHLGDTKAPWPAGTQLGDIREFLFDCQAYDSAQAFRTVFRISYLDYAGDLLEPRRDHHKGTGEIEEKVKHAHALLVIIDGQRVLQLLAGELAGRDYFNLRLQPLLGLAGRASCPIQLIVSKWDLVRRPGESSEHAEARLKEVKACLERYLDIEHLLRGSPGHPQKKARLIPVSAVGPDYAEVREDGSVQKLQDGELAPINAEVPLCAVLPDVIEQAAFSQAAPDVRREVDDEVRRKHPVSLAAVVRSVLSSQAGWMLRKTLSGIVGEEVVRLFVEMLVREKTQEDTPPHGSAPIDADVTRLRAAVVAEMKFVVRLCEDRLNTSKLRTRW